VLQQGEYMSVGGRTPIKTDVRIVAATHKDLRNAIAAGTFREDLFYRLNVVPVRLPPLRDRTEDIPDLIHHFLKNAVKEGLSDKRISPEGMEAMRRYSWPGNVRELENLVRRLSALYPQDQISAEIIANELKPAGSVEGNLTASISDQPVISLELATERYLARYFAGFDGQLPPAGLHQRILDEIEKPLLHAALAATNGNQIKTADLLGLNRNTVRKKIRDLGIAVYKMPRAPGGA
ncbi:MAG: sigma 54-interacting transcriptional regulator, partial [Notoacmeibacter sp.]